MDPKEEKENSASKAEASESEHIKELPLELLDPSADSASAGDSTGVEDMQADASKDKLQNVGETDDNLETSKTEIPVENNETKCEKETDTSDDKNESLLDDDARNRMFNKGLNYDKEGKKDDALKCYLKCLVGLKENSRFALLPQCLRNIGDIYYGKDEYDKAISFIQAEKMYYESVLIDDTELQKHIDEVTSNGEGNDGTDANIDALRATEYEQLARLCLEEKQPQLALEYAGKATKLRQKVYGDGHPVVQQTLDFFATVYAEVGKVQYTESMGKYDPTEKPDTSGEISQPSTPTNEPTSILRKRKTTEGESEKRVRFDESHLQQDEATDREEQCARMVLLILFITLLMILIMLGLYIYCSLNQTAACKNFRQLMLDAVMRIRYLYYHYTTSAKGAQYG